MIPLSHFGGFPHIYEIECDEVSEFGKFSLEGSFPGLEMSHFRPDAGIAKGVTVPMSHQVVECFRLSFQRSRLGIP